MEKKLLVVLTAAVAVSLACSAYAIHDLTTDGTKFPLAGPDAGKLYDFITMAKPNYKLWSIGPGKNEYTPANEPHGAFVTARANNIALDSLKKNEGMADGSIIVMEDYNPDKNLQGCTVMYKIKGYNPEAGDWFWVKYSAPNGYVVASGKVEACISCHSAQKDNDYIFSGEVKHN